MALKFNVPVKPKVRIVKKKKKGIPLSRGKTKGIAPLFAPTKSRGIW